MTERRKTYDGREITMVTLDTQTDWDWVEKTEMESVTYEGDSKDALSTCTDIAFKLTERLWSKQMA